MMCCNLTTKSTTNSIRMIPSISLITAYGWSVQLDPDAILTLWNYGIALDARGEQANSELMVTCPSPIHGSHEEKLTDFCIAHRCPLLFCLSLVQQRSLHTTSMACLYQPAAA